MKKPSGLWQLEHKEGAGRPGPLRASRTLSEKRGCAHWLAPVCPHKQPLPFTSICVYSLPLEWVWNWKTSALVSSGRDLYGLPAVSSLPSPPLYLWGWGVSCYFVFNQACVSWDWVTLIYDALDSLTKDSGTGHLFSEWWFPVLPQPCSAGA